MFFNISLLIALILSLSVMTASLVAAIRSHKMELSQDGDSLYKRHSPLTPFQIFLVGFSIGTALLFIPIYYADYFPQEAELARIFKSVFLAIHNTMRVFILDGDFDIIENAVTDPNRVYEWLGIAYSVYGSIVFVAAPVMTASFVLSFFKNASAYAKYTLHRSTKIYYISELNERSLALASNILSEKKPGTLVAFFDVHEMTEEMSSEMLVRAKRLGAVCFYKDITEVDLKPRIIDTERRFYFISENEDKNVKQALTLINHCRSSNLYNKKTTAFYVFASSFDSEVMLDSVDNGNMTVRRVNENRNLVLSTLMQEKEIFSHYIEKDGKKIVNALIVGSGSYGTELAKALCWCGQLPGYEVNIHIFDKEKNIKKRFSAIAPELVKKSGVRKEGEAYYNIAFHPEIDVYTTDFSDEIEKIGDITVAFITLGNDQANVNVAMMLRREMSKLKIKKGTVTPNIYSVVYSTLKNDTILQNGGLKCLGEHEYDIRFIGDIRTRYSLDVVEQEKLEELGLKIHLGWNDKNKKDPKELTTEESAKAKKKEEENKAAYDKYEYYRRGSIATAVHIQVLDNLNITFPDDDSQQENEHTRWNAYMRSEGYVYDKDVKDYIARTHPNLEAYKKLDEKTRQIDKISAEARASIK